MKIIGDLILEEDYFIEEDLIVEGNIICKNKAWDIKAWDIEAWDIKARDIDFWAVCYARESFKCKSCKGRREHNKFFCLDKEIEILQ